MDTEKIKAAVRGVLEAIGEDPDREGLRDTPKRVAAMYEEIFSGLAAPITKEEITTFTEQSHNEMISVRDIPLYSMCEHHLLPFHGVCHVFYIPKSSRIMGLSKIARIVDSFAKKPQLQERLTTEIADFIMAAIDPQGVAVIIEAEHMCMTMRGVRKPGCKTQTSALRGIFRSDARTRAEAFALVNR